MYVFNFVLTNFFLFKLFFFGHYSLARSLLVKNTNWDCLTRISQHKGLTFTANSWRRKGKSLLYQTFIQVTERKTNAAGSLLYNTIFILQLQNSILLCAGQWTCSTRHCSLNLSQLSGLRQLFRNTWSRIG